MSEIRICKYCGMELLEDVPHGLRICHLHAVNRIAELEAVIEILTDQQHEAKNILIDKNLHIDSLYEEGYKLQWHIAKLELIANELFEALTLTYNKLPEHWRKDYCPYDYHFLKVKLVRAKELDETNDTLFYDIYRLQSRVAELEAEIDQLTAHDATERQDDKWIPVSKRLPDNWKPVLTIDISKSTRDMVTAFFNPETSLWSTHFSCDLWVTHWMPLPEPPIVYGKVCEE